MNNLVYWFWVLLVFALGTLAGWWLSRRSSPSSPSDSATASIESTQTAHLEAQLRQTQIAYQLASEMSRFKAGFLVRTSHELRSPLNGLLGTHQLILSDLCDSPEEEREFIAQAHTSALKMVKILDDILDVAKVDHGSVELEVQPIQLSQVFKELHHLTHLQAKNRNLRLTIEPPEAEVYVLADPRRLNQALMGLVDTAIAQMQEGDIRVSSQPLPDRGVVFLWIEDDRPRTAWSEALDLIQSQAQVKNLLPGKADQVQRSPGMTLLMTLQLLESLNIPLELMAARDSGDPGDRPLNRLQCTLPMVVPEEEE